MSKFLLTALVALAMPVAASASSINLSAALVSVNKDMNISSSGILGAGNTGGRPADGPCIGIGTTTCGDPVGCPTSPENPTALLGMIGVAGLAMGRFGYARLRSRRPVAPAVAA